MKKRCCGFVCIMLFICLMCTTNSFAFVDPLSDSTIINAHENITFTNTTPELFYFDDSRIRKTQEDSESYIVYQDVNNKDLTGFQLEYYQTANESKRVEPHFFVSTDGTTFNEVDSVKKEILLSQSSYSNYRYNAKSALPVGTKFLKIVLPASTSVSANQIGRVRVDTFSNALEVKVASIGSTDNFFEYNNITLANSNSDDFLGDSGRIRLDQTSQDGYAVIKIPNAKSIYDFKILWFESINESKRIEPIVQLSRDGETYFTVSTNQKTVKSQPNNYTLMQYSLLENAPNNCAYLKVIIPQSDFVSANQLGEVEVVYGTSLELRTDECNDTSSLFDYENIISSESVTASTEKEIYLREDLSLPGSIIYKSDTGINSFVVKAVSQLSGNTEPLFYASKDSQTYVRIQANAFLEQTTSTHKESYYVNNQSIYSSYKYLKIVIPAAESGNDVAIAKVSIGNAKGSVRNIAWQWGMGESWWYGILQAFSANSNIHVDSTGSYEFSVTGKLEQGQTEGMFGAMLNYPHSLEEGFLYTFTIKMDQEEMLPDVITIDNHVVWNKSTSVYENEVVRFSYAPQTTGLHPICFITNSMTESKTLFFTNAADEFEMILDRKYTANAISYSVQQLPASTVFQQCETPLQMHEDTLGQPESYTQTIQPITYEGSGVQVIEKHAYSAEPLVAVKDLVDYATFQPRATTSNQDFKLWIKSCYEAEIKNIILTPFIDIMANTVDTKLPEGLYEFEHINEITKGGDTRQWTQSEREMYLSQSAQNIVEGVLMWKSLVPNGKVMIFLPELNSSFGNYEEGIENSSTKNISGYEAIANGGLSAWDLGYEFIQNYKMEILSKLGPSGENVKFFSTFDRPGFMSEHAIQSGMDIVMNKNIHRQNTNVAVANARGGSFAYDQAFGLDLDPWDRNYWYSYSEAEVSHIAKQYFYSGATYMMHELPILTHTGSDELSGYAASWYDAIKYVKTHPKLGSQHVNIAFMRGVGDEWNRFASPSANWEAYEYLPTIEATKSLQAAVVPTKWEKLSKQVSTGGLFTSESTYLWDYNLLNIVFNDFGHVYKTSVDKLATGTPYGPVDLISETTSLDKLKNYDVIVYLGRGLGMSEEIAENLQVYVEQGGSLVMAAGQLKDEQHEFPVSHFCDIKLEDTAYDADIPYTVISSENSTYIVDYCVGNTQNPVVATVNYGQGKLRLYSGEWLNYFENNSVEDELKSIFEDVKYLDFDSGLIDIEYMVSQKGSSYIIPFLNHSRGQFPSGIGSDYGAYQGSITVNANNLDIDTSQPITVCVSSYSEGNQTPFELVEISHEIVDGNIEFTLDVSDVQEIVIGPTQTITSDYYA